VTSDTNSSSTTDLPTRVAAAVAAIREHSPLAPHVAITLGSGLGGVIDTLTDAVRIPTGELPHWPRSTVTGHAGRLALAHWRGVPVVALSGRSHRYEGYSLDRVTFGVRVMHALGARTQVFTNAVGAIHPEFEPGDLMVATDHINFIGKRGLLTTDELRARGPARRYASPHSERLRAALIEAADRAGILLRRGTLLGSHGPTYETSAEVQMARVLGADAVCMSTVHEVTVAAELGCEAVSLSCVTNRATGLSAVPLTHAEVTEVADRVASRLRTLLEGLLDEEKSAGRG